MNDRIQNWKYKPEDAYFDEELCGQRPKAAMAKRGFEHARDGREQRLELSSDKAQWWTHERMVRQARDQREKFFVVVRKCGIWYREER